MNIFLGFTPIELYPHVFMNECGSAYVCMYVLCMNECMYVCMYVCMNV